MRWYQKLWVWIRRMAHLYEKEIKDFVDDMLDFAFANLDEQSKENWTPAIRKKIRNKVLAEILIMGIDTTTVKGKSATSQIVKDAVDWFTSEGE